VCPHTVCCAGLAKPILCVCKRLTLWRIMCSRRGVACAPFLVHLSIFPGAGVCTQQQAVNGRKHN
jgi:hypothetical protein